MKFSLFSAIPPTLTIYGGYLGYTYAKRIRKKRERIEKKGYEECLKKSQWNMQRERVGGGGGGAELECAGETATYNHAQRPQKRRWVEKRENEREQKTYLHNVLNDLKNVWKLALSVKCPCNLMLAKRFIAMHEKMNMKRMTMHVIFASAGKEKISVLNKFKSPFCVRTKRIMRSTRNTRNNDAIGPTLKNWPTQLRMTRTKSKMFQRDLKYSEKPKPKNKLDWSIIKLSTQNKRCEEIFQSERF